MFDIIMVSAYPTTGYAVEQLVAALCYKPEGWCHRNFSLI